MEERIYRNIWKEIGISDAQVEERLSQLISTFFYDEKERLYLLFAYPKNVQTDLTSEQKKAIKNIIELIKKERFYG